MGLLAFFDPFENGFFGIHFFVIPGLVFIGSRGHGTLVLGVAGGVVKMVHDQKIGGIVLFSSYSERFWDDRLQWFRIQAEHGLIGEIDEKLSSNGVIVCKDGFRATTIGPDDFIELTSDLNVTPKIIEVDGSSLFCEIFVE